jgi:hypothetical protein
MFDTNRCSISIALNFGLDYSIKRAKVSQDGLKL